MYQIKEKLSDGRIVLVVCGSEVDAQRQVDALKRCGRDVWCVKE